MYSVRYIKQELVITYIIDVVDEMHTNRAVFVDAHYIEHYQEKM